FSKHAVDVALTKGGAYTTTNTLGLVAGLALAAGMIAITLNSMRVGLLPRWMGILGMFTGVLLIIPLGAVLDVVPAFWMVMMGILFIGRWPNGEPPAWAAGEARAWRPAPTKPKRGQGGEKRATRSQRSGGQLERGLAALLDVERFPPAGDFAEQALLNGPEVYERAAADPLGWWTEQARALHWFE